MTEAERIEEQRIKKDAIYAANEYTCMTMYKDHYIPAYILGATTEYHKSRQDIDHWKQKYEALNNENERLQQQLKIANNKINDLQEQLKSSNDKVSELKSAQEFNREKEREIDTLYKKFIHLANSDGCPKKVSGEIYSILNDSALNRAK